MIRIDPAANRTYHYWHVFVPGAKPGQIYGYRVQGPSDPDRGTRFDPAKVLLDPYDRCVVVPHSYRREATSEEGDNTGVNYWGYSPVSFFASHQAIFWPRNTRKL